MLLPNNIQPELCIYYNAAIILRELQENKRQKYLDLYNRVKSSDDMSFAIFILSLDWLYLIGMAQANDEGWIEICS